MIIIILIILRIMCDVSLVTKVRDSTVRATVYDDHTSSLTDNNNMELVNPSSSSSHVGPGQDVKPNDDHGDSHGHVSSPSSAPSRIPLWIHDMLEKVFQIRKRNSTIEVLLLIRLLLLPLMLYSFRLVVYNTMLLKNKL